MKPIYDYYGLIISFKKEPSLPILLQAERGNRCSAFSIGFSEGLMDTPKHIIGERELDSEDFISFTKLIENNSSEIIKLWLDIFLYGKDHEVEVIKTKLV
jgi:hypothetical protein